MASDPLVEELYLLADAVTPYAIRAAATLRLADHVTAGFTDLSTLAEASGAVPQALGRLMRLLVCRGLFAEREPGIYAILPLGEVLCSDHPSHARLWFDSEGVAGRIDATFPRLTDAVRTGNPVYEAVYGLPFWADVTANPGLTNSFDRLMADVARSTDGIATEYDWSGVRHLVDVGGGLGAVLATILAAQPHLRGTVVDQPETVAQATRYLAERGLAHRASAVAADMFRVVPGSGDVYLLSRVLADWNDQDATMILRRCAEAAGRDNRVLVAERLISEDASAQLVAATDLRLLVYLGGRKRSLRDLNDLINSAGMVVRSHIPLSGGGTVVECLVTVA